MATEPHDLGGWCNGRPIFSDIQDVLYTSEWILVLASPTLYATLTRTPVREHLLRLMAIYIDYAARDGRYSGGGRKAVPYERREPLARKLRAQMETWTPPHLPQEIVDTARELLQAEGYGDPETFPNADVEPVEDLLYWPEGVPKLLREAANATAGPAPEATASRGFVEWAYVDLWNGMPIITVNDTAPPSQRPSKGADIGEIYGLNNWLQVLASPRLYALLRRLPTREHLVRLLDVYLSYVARGDWCNQPQRRGSAGGRDVLARKLRGLLETWTPPELPPESTETARELLEAEALVGPPEGGWDNLQLKRPEPLDDVLLWPEGIPVALRAEQADRA